MNATPYRILFVEDDADDRFIIDEAFREVGYENAIRKFADGEHLIRYLNETDPAAYPAIIVLDNNLPRYDAASILAILRANDQYAAIRTYIYTTLISPMQEQELLSLGAHGCLRKGDDMQQVIAIASRLRDIAEGRTTSGPETWV